MRISVLTLTACLSFALFTGQSSYAQNVWEPPLQDETSPQDEGLGGGLEDLLGRGMDDIMGNLMNDLGPGLEQLGQDFSGALGNVTPLLKDLGNQIDDLRYYQAPERLENGDIIMRRRADAPPPPPIGDNLRNFITPDEQPQQEWRPDPYAPEFEL